MPIELTWMIPDKILQSRWIGEVSINDITVLLEELKIILDSANQPVHTLIDLNDLVYVSLDVIRTYLQNPVANHPNRGEIAVVNISAQTLAIADWANRTAQRDVVHLFETRSEARDYLLRNEPPDTSDTDT